MTNATIANTTGAAALSAHDLNLKIDGQEEETLDVLDLPQLYTKPSAQALLSTLLHDLSSEPPSWDTTPRSGTPRTPLSGASTPARRKRKVRNEGIPSYLTKIIASPLGWIKDDSQKESVWEAASQRLSERSGRSAMGALTRNFPIPLHFSSTNTGESGDTHLKNLAGHVSEPFDPEDELEEELNLTLFEPALTSDNLGFKTWASSYLLAKRMCILQTTLPHLKEDDTVLELGAGTGLVGLAAAAVLKAHVILTDLPEIVSNLQRNVEGNAAAIAAAGGSTAVEVLDWSKPEAFQLGTADEAITHRFALILAADPIYSPDHPRLLVQAVGHHLSKSKNARAVVEMPLRDAYQPERDEFKARMKEFGLHIIEEGQEVGFDDWSAPSSDELTEVACWWSVWGW